MKNLKTKMVFTIMLLMLVAFIPAGSSQAGTLSASSDVKQVTLTLDQKPGVLYIPTEGNTILT